MPFTLNVLTTDWLVYLLVGGIVWFSIYASRHEHLRAPWRQVLRRPLAMSALMVLSVYVIIGLLDSVHLREKIDSPAGNEYSHEVISVLDILTTTLRTQVERTYSAPFAVHAYTKEMVTGDDGKIRRQYPRLKYGGAHLDDVAGKAGDIAYRIARASIVAIIIWLLVTVAVVCWIARIKGRNCSAVARDVLTGNFDVPWRVLLLTLGLIILVLSIIYSLTGYYHILGTDQVGNNVLYKSFKSIRTGLLIGTLTTLVMLPFAVILGIMAGYFRGWIDDVIQYTYTTLSSIPSVLLIAAVILSLQVYMDRNPDLYTTIERADMRLLFLCIVLGVTSWTTLCRLMRGETLKLREVDYVQAAVALGASSHRIMLRHIFPNLMHIVLISVVLDFSGLVLAEAVLSYLGVGVDPTMDSWGNMINGARLEMAREPMVWWSLGAAFVFMFGLVLSANLFSDAVRDAFDPRLRGR